MSVIFFYVNGKLPKEKLFYFSDFNAKTLQLFVLAYLSLTETHFKSPQKDDCCPVQKGQTQNGLKASKIIRKVLSVCFFLFMAS